MKKVKRLNRLLIVLAVLLGLALGSAATLLSLNIVADQKGLSLAGLICVIATALLALLFPVFVHERDNAIHRVDLQQNRFGMEVSFLDENQFLRAVKKQGETKNIYALHASTDEKAGDLLKKMLGFILSESLEEECKGKALVGYTELGDFLFYGFESDESFLEAMKRVDERLSKDKDLPPYTILLGSSASDVSLENRCNEALTATLLDETIRDNLSLLTYYEEDKNEKKLDFDFEKEQGRLSYYVLPFGGEEKTELELLSPALYDPYRGDLMDKELFHSLHLSGSRNALDHACINVLFQALKQNKELPLLGLRIGGSTCIDASFLPELAKKAEEAEVSLNRIVLFLPTPNLGQHGMDPFIAKAQGLGIHLGIYEFDGDKTDLLVKRSYEYGIVKPELVRKNAKRDVLEKTVAVLRALDIRPLLEADKLGGELSDLPSSEIKRLTLVEEEEA